MGKSRNKNNMHALKNKSQRTKCVHAIAITCTASDKKKWVAAAKKENMSFAKWATAILNDNLVA